MNRNVEFRENAFDALLLGRFDQSACGLLWDGENYRTWNGVDRGQREDRRIVIIEGSLVLAMMLQETVRRHVAVKHDPRMTMGFPFMNVFWRGDRR